MSFGTPTRRSFTVAKKLEVIEAYESRFDFNLTKTAWFLDLDKGVLSRWIKNREGLQKLPRTLKKLSINREVGTYPELEKKLMEWFREQRRKKIAVKRYKLKHTARRLANNNNIDVSGFQFSHGWSAGFLRRHGLTSRKVTHKAQQNKRVNDDNIKIVNDFLIECGKISTKKYNFGCVYNMDETPLYMDMPHNVTLDQ